MKLHMSDNLTLLGAGREKKIYAVPPYTKVAPLDFEDYPFSVENFEGRHCRLCGATGVYLDELVDEETGETYYQCNDTAYCHARCEQQAQSKAIGATATVKAAASADVAEVGNALTKDECQEGGN